MGRGFETDMRGKMGKRRGYLKVSQKRSDTVGEPHKDSNSRFGATQDRAFLACFAGCLEFANSIRSFVEQPRDVDRGK